MVERGDEDGGFISAWGEIVRLGAVFGYGLIKKCNMIFKNIQYSIAYIWLLTIGWL